VAARSKALSLREVACWDRGFESRRQHGYLSECCVLSGRGLCDGPITRLEEFYRVLCAWVWSWGGLGPLGAVGPGGWGEIMWDIL